MAIHVVATAVILGMLLGGCTSAAPKRGSTPQANGCPVTTPTSHPPVQLPKNPVVSNPGVPEEAFGNQFLWVAPSSDGTIQVSEDADRPGFYGTKVPWWRVAAGELKIKAVRLDGAGRFDYHAGTVSEYGPTGFVPSSLYFSAPGCWRVTGSVGDGSLTFVARITVLNP